MGYGVQGTAYRARGTDRRVNAPSFVGEGWANGKSVWSFLFTRCKLRLKATPQMGPVIPKGTHLGLLSS